MSMSDLAGAIVLVGRILFSIMFIRSAVTGHIPHSKRSEAYARTSGFPLPAVAGWPAGIWLLAGGLSVALGIWPDVGALMLGLFVIPAAAWFHRYWTIEDQGQRMTQGHMFYRNVTALGASLVMFGMFATTGPALRFSITAPLFSF
jgi:putative oxidoreductase